jgi:hypothetical protein
MSASRDLWSLIGVLAPLGLLAGCGSSSPLGEFTGEVCLFEGDALSDLEPAEGTDYIGLRQLDFESPPAIIAEWGVRCQDASDASSCEAALEALPPRGIASLPAGFHTVDYDLVVERGDEVAGITTRDALLELLGTIDTPNEAALVALTHNFLIPCDTPNVRKEGDDFVLLGERGGCNGKDLVHFEIIVTPSGEVREGDSEVVRGPDPNCVTG